MHISLYISQILSIARWLANGSLMADGNSDTNSDIFWKKKERAGGLFYLRRLTQIRNNSDRASCYPLFESLIFWCPPCVIFFTLSVHCLGFPALLRPDIRCPGQVLHVGPDRYICTTGQVVPVRGPAGLQRCREWRTEVSGLQAI